MAVVLTLLHPVLVAVDYRFKPDGSKTYLEIPNLAECACVFLQSLRYFERMVVHSER